MGEWVDGCVSVGNNCDYETRGNEGKKKCVYEKYSICKLFHDQYTI